MIRGNIFRNVETLLVSLCILYGYDGEDKTELRPEEIVYGCIVVRVNMLQIHIQIRENHK